MAKPALVVVLLNSSCGVGEAGVSGRPQSLHSRDLATLEDACNEATQLRREQQHLEMNRSTDGLDRLPWTSECFVEREGVGDWRLKIEDWQQCRSGEWESGCAGRGAGRWASGAEKQLADDAPR